MSISLNSNVPVSESGHRDPWRVMPAEIVRIDQEVPDVRTYHVALKNPEDAAGYSIRPGQFNMLYVPGVGEAAISVSGDSRCCNPLMHTVRAIGAVTRSLSQMTASATLGVRGPFGSPWPTEHCAGRDLVLVAGGIGLAPLRPVIYDVLARRNAFGNVWLLMGARSPDDLVYHRDYGFWKSRGIEVHATVDHGGPDWTGDVGFVTPLVDRLQLRDPKQTALMTCGPEIMMRLAAEAALGLGIPAEQIFVTLERNMKCAFGHCGHCQFGPHFVCKDGPVLSYDRVSGLLGVQSL